MVGCVRISFLDENLSPFETGLGITLREISSCSISLRVKATSIVVV
jgi:hypothetical protein